MADLPNKTISHSRKISHRFLILGCVLTLVYVLAFVALVCGLSQLPKPVNRHDYGDMASSFAEALRLRDAARAKSLVSAEQWNRIDTWISTHATVFTCPTEWRFWTDSFWGGERSYGAVGHSNADPTTANGSYGYGCSRGDPYSFAVEGIVLKQTAGEWLIVDWRTIDETCGWQDDPCD